jgi:8-oxo-dGTP diphosphatase
MNIYLAQKAFILKEGKILILKRSPKEDCFENMWDIPGGKIDFGETPEESLKREVKEECGIDIKVRIPVSVWTFFKNNNKTQVVGISFLCNYISGDIRLSKEHVDYKWIDPKEIENFNLHKGIKKDVKAINLQIKTLLDNMH